MNNNEVGMSIESSGIVKVTKDKIFVLEFSFNGTSSIDAGIEAMEWAIERLQNEIDNQRKTLRFGLSLNNTSA